MRHAADTSVRKLEPTREPNLLRMAPLRDSLANVNQGAAQELLRVVWAILHAHIEGADPKNLISAHGPNRYGF